ncbi:hypothetical protein F443_21503 [Phytophthora nicotianae P1569]|uniref:Uncharacterized protein n=2 Tax=Phytophthora nicotianae TaxID=4792 RepID=V9DZT6_PHYNI|nr:hypothetical protein F443_21503 [Phytophthora nicotianae P1569]ETO60259.1 hypothetical protein F444_21515 [Phytophthora nicotianae P1976]
MQGTHQSRRSSYAEKRRARDHDKNEYGQAGRAHDEPNMDKVDVFKSSSSMGKLG